MNREERKKIKERKKMTVRKKNRTILVAAVISMLLVLPTPFTVHASVEGMAAGFEGPVGFTQPLEGIWQIQNGEWSFLTPKGIAKNRWACIVSEGTGCREWYCFDTEGHLLTGWQKGSSGSWYYLRKTDDSRYGAMEKGLILEPEDGRYYYLDPDTGVMRTGWIRTEGKYRYFSETGETNSWFWNSAQKRWMYRQGGGRSVGSMYVNERTPDGSYVDAQGVRIEE